MNEQEQQDVGAAETRVVSCFRCGRTLTNPLSMALGIGPICRGKASGGRAAGPGYPYKDVGRELRSGDDVVEGKCGCAILAVPYDLWGVTYARECMTFCCEHCPSRHETHCPADRLRQEGVLRAYPIGSVKYCLGYWTDESEGGEIWGLFWLTKDSPASPGDLYKMQLLEDDIAFEGLGRADSLLGAQILALQETPLRAS